MADGGDTRIRRELQVYAPIRAHVRNTLRAPLCHERSCRVKFTFYFALQTDRHTLNAYKTPTNAVIYDNIEISRKELPLVCDGHVMLFGDQSPDSQYHQSRNARRFRSDFTATSLDQNTHGHYKHNRHNTHVREQAELDFNLHHSRHGVDPTLT